MCVQGDEHYYNLMKFYKCDPQWPVCLYDFSFRNLNPKFNTYRVAKKLDTFVIDNYFTNEILSYTVFLANQTPANMINRSKNCQIDDLLI